MSVVFLKYLTSSNGFCLNNPSIRRAVVLPLFFSFTSHIFSPLSSVADAGQNTIAEFLLKECGLCPSEITKIMKKMPSLARTRSNQTAQEAVQLLRNSGFTESQLKKTIVRSPSIITLKAYGQLKPKIELLKTLACQDLGNVISIVPRILTYNLESLKSKVEYVKTLGVSEGSKEIHFALRIVAKNRLEIIPKKLELLRSLGILEGSKTFNSRNSVLLTISLTISVDKMQKNMDFLMHTAGLTPNILVPHPWLLSYSVEKRLKPRYRVFRYLSTVQNDNNAKHLHNPVPMFNMSEERFLQKFIKCSAQAEILFDLYKGKSADFTIT